MNGWKYIIFRRPDLIRVPVVFPPLMDHSDMAEAIKQQFPAWESISAGICDGNIECVYGNSHTLSLKSNPDDKRSLNR